MSEKSLAKIKSPLDTILDDKTKNNNNLWKQPDKGHKVHSTLALRYPPLQKNPPHGQSHLFFLPIHKAYAKKPKELSLPHHHPN